MSELKTVEEIAHGLDGGCRTTGGNHRQYCRDIAAALRSDRERVRAECKRACCDESLLEGCVTEDDQAYQRAVDDCVDAIATLDLSGATPMTGGAKETP